MHALDPESWTLQGSSEGVIWTVLDIASNVPWISEDGIYFNKVGGVSYNLVYVLAL